MPVLGRHGGRTAAARKAPTRRSERHVAASTLKNVIQFVSSWGLQEENAVTAPSSSAASS